MRVSLKKSGRRKRPSTIALRHQELRTIQALRIAVTFSLIAVFGVTVLSVLAIIFFVGFGKMDLSDQLIFTLIAETVAHAGAFFLIVTRFLFSNRGR